MSNKTASGDEKKSMVLINTLSVVIPLAVAVLLGIRTKLDLGEWTAILPHLNAVINSLTAIFLLVGLWFIKQKNIQYHRYMMTVAFGLGACFLVFYVIYHLTNASTSFGGEGNIRYFYYFILISHILMSLIVLPFVLRAMFFAVTKQFVRHRKVTKIAFPIWLYVSITGVIAYLMISPYYIH
jgi:putative membrane protein